MTTDQQVRRLKKHMNQGDGITEAAAKAGMDPKTARKYLRSGMMPGQMKRERNWRTREDVFAEHWKEVVEMLRVYSEMEAKTLFFYLQREHPGRYEDGQLRTLQRKLRRWKALEGPAKEVFFPQQHIPGKLCASDFTDMTELGVTIRGMLFRHKLYHFVLPYSNWETGTVCFSESMESLRQGLQNALWELGGVPLEHLTDRLSAAVNNLHNPAEFTTDYQKLLDHLGLKGRKIQAGKANENGDSEKSHDVLKHAMDQFLMLRGNRDFDSQDDYESFVREMFRQLNAGRKKRFAEEIAALRALPARRLDDFKMLDATVTRFSTIRICTNVYSVPARLIGETVRVKLHAESLEVRFADMPVAQMPRLHGKKRHFINYRHIIDSLVRKPGAFENYQYRDDLFPTTRFRAAYDALKSSSPVRASSEYLKILQLAACETEEGVDAALRALLDDGAEIGSEIVRTMLLTKQEVRSPVDVQIDPANPAEYDVLLTQKDEEAA